MPNFCCSLFCFFNPKPKKSKKLSRVLCRIELTCNFYLILFAKWNLPSIPGAPVDERKQILAVVEDEKYKELGRHYHYYCNFVPPTTIITAVTGNSTPTATQLHVIPSSTMTGPNNNKERMIEYINYYLLCWLP